MLLLGLLLTPIADGLAQSPYQSWQFRPMEPSNARGAPPWQPAPSQAGEPGQQTATALPATDGLSSPGQMQPPGMQPPGMQPAMPQAQWQLGQYPQPEMPLGQGPIGLPQQPLIGATPGQQYPGVPAQGNQYPGNQYPSNRYQGNPYPAGPYQGGQYAPPQFAPQPYSPYGQRNAAGMLTPQLEVELADERPYVQENVLIRLRVISSGNLATASPDLAAIDEVLFDKIEGPNTSTRGSGNNRDIVNEFVIAMTPLRDGELSVGPLKVTGTLAGGVPFEAVAREPLRLQVRPPMATVRPWLPVQTLRIKTELDNAGEMERGRPVTLTIELEAQGATGDQLPSLEHMLRSDAFRVYREQTMTDTRLSASGKTLIGKRIEYYTLVPQTGGRLQLPELRLGWWNVDTATREASSVPIRSFSVAGEPAPFSFSRSGGSGSGDGANWSAFWLPLAGVLLLLIGYWGGVWLRGRSKSSQSTAPMLPRLIGALTTAAAASGRALGRSVRLLDPSPLLREARRALAALTPRSARVYQCAKSADSASDPAAWCLAFQRQACRNLQANAREPLPRMADRIINLRPGADRERLLRLMQQLDSALYNREDIDFARWKHDFRRALRPGTGALRSLLAARIHRGQLPALNPEPQRSGGAALSRRAGRMG